MTAETKEPEALSVSADVGAEALSPPPWMLKEEKPEVKDALPKKVSDASSDVGGLILDLVVSIHNKVADWTGYLGFKLDEDDRRIWGRVSNLIAKYVPFEKMPEMLIIVSVVMVEISKVGGFVMYWKETHPKGGDK